MLQEIDQIITRLRSQSVTREEIMENLDHDAALVRANAIEAASRIEMDSELLNRLMMEAKADRNCINLMGNITLGYVVVACLLRSHQKAAQDAAEELICNWPEVQRDDLLWYLESEGLK